jgi:hypothetical protein
MSILKRPPGDDFTFKLFFKLQGKIKKPKSSIYAWALTLDPDYIFRWFDDDGNPQHETEMDYRKLLQDDIKQDIVVLGVKDHMTSNGFNPWTDNMPIVADYLSGLFDFYPKKQFVLITSLENLDHYIKNPNVSIVSWGGDITNQQAEYTALDPILDKNFDSSTTYLSLNRNQRPQRALSVALQYGLRIYKNSLMSCMFKDRVGELVSYAGWPFTEEQQHIKDLMVNGYHEFKSCPPRLNDDEEIYVYGNNDNVSNFKNKLTPYYKDTFVEIVSETSFGEVSFLLTEKTLNSIYGCNFPIILCSKGAVSFLRSMGMDMFDDIIDHSYDSIENPIDRLYTAITSNIELLTNNQKTKQLWQDNQHRFINNVAFAKNTLYNFYSLRAEETMLKVVHDKNL